MFVNRMPRYEVLSPAALEQVDRGWKRLVSEIGIQFDHPRACELFADAGRERSAISIGQPTGSLRSGAGESERGPDQDGGGEREAFPARRHASAVASVPRYAVSAQTIRIAAPIAR